MNEEERELSRESDFDQALHEILNQNIDVEYEEQWDQNLTKSEFDQTNEQLLEYYVKKHNYDFQEELKKQLAPKLAEKTSKEIEKHQEKEREEQIQDKAKEELGAEGVDKEAQEQAEKKVAQKESKGTVTDIRQELRKQTYIAIYEAYTKDVMQYKNHQLKHENMSLSLKDGLEVLTHEKYLRNFEDSYKGYAKHHHLEEKELAADPEIKKMKESFSNEIRQMDRHNENEIEKNLRTIETLKARRQEIAKEMAETADGKNTVEENDMLYQEYLKLTYQMEMLSPTIEEYQRQAEDTKQMENVRSRDYMVPQKGEVSLGGYTDYKNETIEKEPLQEKTQEIEQKDDITILQTLDTLTERIQTLMDEDPIQNYTEIKELILQCNTLLGEPEEELEQMDREQEMVAEETKEEPVAHSTSLMDECKNGVEDPNRVTTKMDTNEELNSQLNKIQEGKSKLQARSGYQGNTPERGPHEKTRTKNY